VSSEDRAICKAKPTAWVSRNDLHVTVGAVTVRPALALGSWVAFKQTDDTTAMLMGDLVLVESNLQATGATTAVAPGDFV